ncbi:hypothetical protein [Methylophaga pinxianii]|uniref:hypothetical protein n=1 Tax=Methylophaga pinxianii TaxID=2881052 RepID=UPI001CF5199A|nr:hypothetical protein [Methylophaga pinxianii]MCB2426675.1 hypothetical protein [Methylophaga pinxianii]UPH44483.1 hypothetical protein LGT42_008115 [Methylophaga pinxianii]
MNPNRFINDILKPWDMLNSLLVQQYAFQPDLSDITRLTGNIAVSIRHQIDFAHLNDKQANNLSQAHQIISDAGDYWKHGSLRKQERNCPIRVAAAFEYAENGTFRFIRNIATLAHSSLGEHDFLTTSAEAARFWMSQHGFNVEWKGLPNSAPPIFEQSARLKFDPRYCINMSNTQIRFFKKISDGKLIPFDPPQVRFEVYE